MDPVGFFKKLINFLKDVCNDERIPQRDKAILAALIALLISPIDFIPDWIPVFGQLDDLVMLCLILDYFFVVLDSQVMLKHWPWGMKSFAWVRRMARFGSFFVPRFLKKKLWSYVGDPY